MLIPEVHSGQYAVLDGDVDQRLAGEVLAVRDVDDACFDDPLDTGCADLEIIARESSRDVHRLVHPRWVFGLSQIHHHFTMSEVCVAAYEHAFDVVAGEVGEEDEIAKSAGCKRAHLMVDPQELRGLDG